MAGPATGIDPELPCTAEGCAFGARHIGTSQERKVRGIGWRIINCTPLGWIEFVAEFLL